MLIRALLFSIFIYACSSGNSIKIKGSDTEVNLVVSLVESYTKERRAEKISVSGGGSGLGIVSLLNGTADVANSSRSMKSEELNLFHLSSIDYDSFIFARDAIAIVVNKSVTLDSLTPEMMVKIFSGQVPDWTSISSQKFPINIYGRQSNSGTYEFVRKKLHIHFSPKAKQMNGNAQILEAIRTDFTGIGYVSAGYLMNGNLDGLKVLKIKVGKQRAISPLDCDYYNIKDYYLTRPLFQYYKKESWKKIQQFLQFEREEIGACIIANAGYYPIISE